MKYKFIAVLATTFLLAGANVSAVSITGIENGVNAIRAKHGLPALRPNTTLDNSAFARGYDMCNKDYFSHHAPDNPDIWHFFTEAGYKGIMMGENLAYQYGNDTDQFILDRWEASPDHMENILGNFDEQGVGLKGCYNYQGRFMSIITVNHFGNSGVAAATTVAPKPVAKAQTVSPVANKPTSLIAQVNAAQTQPTKAKATTQPQANKPKTLPLTLAILSAVIGTIALAMAIKYFRR